MVYTSERWPKSCLTFLADILHDINVQAQGDEDGQVFSQFYAHIERSASACFHWVQFYVWVVDQNVLLHKDIVQPAAALHDYLPHLFFKTSWHKNAVCSAMA